jgi:iron(III) transport system substrate-binding protein
MHTLIALLGSLFFAGCRGGEAVSTPQAQVKTQPTLIIYSGRGESLVGNLFERLNASGKFKVEVQYGKTGEMVTRMMAEGEACPADLIFAQDSGHLGVLAARGMLNPLPASLLDQVDPDFRDPGGTWVGTSGRLRTLVYNTDALGPETLPQSLSELADPKWKGKLGWAPSNGSLHAHISALRHSWGEDETEAWLLGVKANKPTRYPKNSPQVEAAHNGAIELGWVNHYYLHRLNPEGRKAANWSFTADGDMGNILMVSGVGIRRGSPNAAEAEALIGWLLSAETQSFFAEEGFEYPTRPGIQTHDQVPPLEGISLATVSQEHLADLGPTRELLRELGLL